MKHTRGPTLIEPEVGERDLDPELLNPTPVWNSGWTLNSGTTLDIYMGRTARERFRDIQLRDLRVVAGQDAVTDGEAGVGGDDAVVGAGDGQARAAVVLVWVESRHRRCSRDSVVPSRPDGAACVLRWRSALF